MKKNERGFSLVIVLFAIVLFSVIGLSLFTVTNSNAKQINKTYEQLVATDLAEMGIIHFETLYSEAVSKAIETSKSSFRTIMTNKEHPKYDEYVPLTLTVFQRDFNTILTSELSKILYNSGLSNGKITQLLEEEKSYSIGNINPKFTGNFIYTTTFTSIGKANANFPIELNAHVETDLERFFKEFNVATTTPPPPATNESATELFKLDFDFNNPSFEETAELAKITSSCKSNSIFELKNCKLNTYTINQNNYNLDSITGRLDSDFSLTSNPTSFTNSSVYTSKSVSLDTINNVPIKNVNIFSEGKGTLNQNGFVNSKLYFKLDSTMGTPNQPIQNSELYFGGTLTAANLEKNIANSTIAVAKNLNMGHINSNAAINKLIIHVGNNFTASYFNDPLTNSIINVNGNFKMENFNSPATLNNTKILVKGDYFVGDLQNMYQSTIRIGGNITLNDLKDFTTPKPSGNISSGKIAGIITNSNQNSSTSTPTLIYTKGNFIAANMESNGKVDNAIIYVGGKFEINSSNFTTDSTRFTEKALVCAQTLGTNMLKYKSNFPSRYIYSFDIEADREKFNSGEICDPAKYSLNNDNDILEGENALPTDFLNDTIVEY